MPRPLAMREYSFSRSFAMPSPSATRRRASAMSPADRDARTRSDNRTPHSDRSIAMAQRIRPARTVVKGWMPQARPPAKDRFASTFWAESARTTLAVAIVAGCVRSPWPPRIGAQRAPRVRRDAGTEGKMLLARSLFLGLGVRPQYPRIACRFGHRFKDSKARCRRTVRV
jgi:hypothetical protein